MIVAAEDAKFGLPEVKRGLVAAGGGLMRLPERVPYHLAMEWSLTGELVPATRAYEVALVNRLTPKGGALEAALELGRAISANGPLAVRATKRVIVEAPEWSRAEMFDKQREITLPVRESEDAREGATAFKEKRAPQWKAR
jgi:enoyl-CoA hydratase